MDKKLSNIIQSTIWSTTKNIWSTKTKSFNILFHFQFAKGDDGALGDFSPQVSATCKSSIMNIKVAFNNSYHGAIHARDFRSAQCMQFGDGSNSVALSLNLLAREGHPDYCGILVHNVSGEVRTGTFINNYLFTLCLSLLLFFIQNTSCFMGAAKKIKINGIYKSSLILN